MRVIKDDQGQAWSLRIPTTGIFRVRSALAVNLLEVIDGTIVDRLFNDLALAVDVFFYLCEDQAKQQQMPLDVFRDRWSGDRIEAATRELLLELADFFPSGRRQAILKVLTAHQEVIRKAVLELETKAEATLSALSSGNSPESSESTPALTPAANSNG